MAGKGFSTRERILDQGLRAMSQSGLPGVTLGILAERVGISKSGLFAHFRSIEELQISLLRHTTAIVQEKVVAPTMESVEGLPRLRALVRNWFGWSARAGLEGGCPVAAGMFELDDVEGPVRDEVLALEGRWRELLIGLVQQAIQHGELDRGLDARQFVWELCGIYLSHHASLRFVRDPDADRRANIAVEALLERAGAAASKRKPGRRQQRKQTRTAR